jgi:hypothetical protein
MTYSRTIRFSIIAILIAMISVFALSFASTTFAQDPATPAATDAASIVQGGLEDTARGTFPTTSATTVIGRLISAMLSLTGVIFVVIMVYSGLLYMTAAGEEAKVKKAKSMITTSVIGIVIVGTAYAVTSYVIGILAVATG